MSAKPKSLTDAAYQLGRLTMLREITAAWKDAHDGGLFRPSTRDSFIVGYMQTRLQQIAREEGEKP